jgi:hypothetical protein
MLADRERDLVARNVVANQKLVDVFAVHVSTVNLQDLVSPFNSLHHRGSTDEDVLHVAATEDHPDCGSGRSRGRCHGIPARVSEN